MKKEDIIEMLMQANHQFIINVNHINYVLNLNDRHFINDLGLVAINQKTNRASIVFLDKINSIIIDSKTFFIKS